MNTTIISKKLYFHPLSEEGFSSQSAANRAYKAILNKQKLEQDRKDNAETLRNYVRLNAKSVEDIVKLFPESIKEIFGYDFDLKISGLHFGAVSNSHRAPIGKKTNWCGQDKNEPSTYLGWRGRISGKFCKSNKRNENDKTISDCFGHWSFGARSILGFHTGSGGGGNETWSYDFYFFLEDFPEIAKKYEVYRQYKEKLEGEQREQDKAKGEWACANEKAYEGVTETIENKQKIAELHRQIIELNKRNNEIREGVFESNPFSYPTKFSKEELEKLNVGF